MATQEAIRSLANYPWPKPLDHDAAPTWTGSGFRIGEQVHGVLDYNAAESNWTDALTTFHEEVAGDDHFMDRASRQYAVSQIKQFVTTPRPIILEVGCSSGFLLRDLKARFANASIIGADNVRGPLDALARQVPDVPLLRFDLVKCPLPANSLDIVILLNVLEHIQEDAEALKQVMRILKPGGIVISEVPAGPHLYDVYDKVLLHWRRYNLVDLCQLLERAGFRIVKSSHLGFFIYPAFALVKKRGQHLLAASPNVQKAWVAERIKGTKSNPLLHLLMSVELLLGKWVRFGVGIRCVVTGVKPN